MKQIQGGVTAAKGFEAAGVEAAIKYQNRKDMALIVSKAPCTVAGTFTSNVVKAAPVLWDKQIVEHSAFAQAVVVNSGIANACTGKQGLDCCEAEAKCAGELLGVPTDAVLVASTGVIGMQIPVDKITAGIEKLVAAKADTLEAGSDAAHAIMTTDTISKEIAIETQIGGKTVTLGGMCKGSGMIHPNMCTMLGFVTTDVKISKEMLQKCVSADVVDSFNMISVDGDTSTNDTLLVLANGDLDALPAHLHPIAPDNLCLEVYDAFFPLAQQRQHPLSLTLPEDSVPSIEADPDRVKQLLAILLNNAFDHTPAGTPVELCLTYCGEKITLAVQDHGPGIPDAEKARVFDRFYSADPSRTDKHNFGLGLSVAKELARLHHADLTVTDTPGGGAKFAVTFAARIS